MHKSYSSPIVVSPHDNNAQVHIGWRGIENIIQLNIFATQVLKTKIQK